MALRGAEMTYQTITLDVPEPVYQQIRRAAERIRRPINDVLVEAVTAAAPAMTANGRKLRSALAQMAYLNDAALWQAARSTMPIEQRERLAALHETQQQQPLTAKEHGEERALLELYRETLLVRSQAALLLKQRGYDVDDPHQFAPLE
jgi:hypothetical protein